ncbi:MAG: DNA replication/repair protein RecF [Bacteroidota bacterium]|jgi:DNA replication and repair protein RecF
MWIERLALTDFRNHRSLDLRLDRRPVVLTGANGAGKTNILEAVSLLAPGQGLRRAPYPEIARTEGNGAWAVAASVHTPDGRLEVGTGISPSAASDRSGRIVRINGEDQTGSGALADLLEVVWLTPSMDGLFTGPASERRRFLDRLILCFDPGYRVRVGHFERAMRQRNRLLEDGVVEHARFEGLEKIMAEAGVAVAAARAEAVAGLRAMIEERRVRSAQSSFPWAEIGLEGALERDLAHRAAIDVEDAYIEVLRAGRERDRAAGRTLEGPHRSDFVVMHGPKSMPAHVCSTGEQKALLVGLVLAHAELVKQRRAGVAPILLLDEIAAHLDERRRAGLFAELVELGSQAWMTGTDRQPFAALLNDAQFVPVGDLSSGTAASAQTVGPAPV